MKSHFHVVWIAGLLLAIPLLLPAQTVPAGWSRLDECRLEAADYADGDSFHVNHRGQNFHFRLYFVDCPESDTRFSDRIHEQMRAFDLPGSDAVVSAGLKAKEFTAKSLSSPFTVLTKWEDARGESEQERFYAMVFVGQKNLAQELVRAGFARAFGRPAAYPDDAGGRRFYTELRRLQNQAAHDRRGVFSNSVPSDTLRQPLIDHQAAADESIFKEAKRGLEMNFN